MDTPEEIVWFGVAAVPVIVALVQLCKTSFKLPSQFAPLAAVVFGIAGGLGLHLSHETAHTFAQAVFGGLLAGLSAGGLYSGVKSLRNG
jgi:hypothetical protein